MGPRGPKTHSDPQHRGRTNVERKQNIIKRKRRKKEKKEEKKRKKKKNEKKEEKE